MDPVTITIVSALSAGATAIAKEVGSQAIKDAYQGLKQLIVSRFQKAAPFVEAVAENPASPAEQQVLAKQIDKSGQDPEIKNAALLLLEHLDALKSEPRAQAVFDFKKLNALKKFEISDAQFSGTLLRAEEATFSDDAVFKNLRQTPPAPDPRKN